MRRFLVAGVVLLTLLLASGIPACTPKATPPTTPTKPAPTTPAPTTPTPTKPAPTTPAPTTPAPTTPAKPSVIRIKFATYEAEAHWRTPLMKAFGAELDKRTGGRTETVVYTGGTLGGPAELADNLLKGITDMSAFVASTYPGLIWSHPLFQTPMMMVDPAVGAWVAQDLIANGFYEIKGAKILMAHRSETGGLLQSKAKVTKLEDVKGKVYGGTPGAAKWIQSWGASFAAAPPPEIYGMLERGVIDGNLLGAGLAKAQKLGEVTKYFLLGLTGGDLHLISINQATWDKLPDDIKVIVLELSKEFNTKITLEVYRQGDISLQYLRDSKIEIYRLSDVEFARFRTLADAMPEATAKDLDAKGFPGTEALARIRLNLRAIGEIR